MSVERLTGRKENGRAYILGCPDFEIPKIFALIIQTVVDKCADYEDTGLEPQEITRIVNEYGRGHTLRTHAAERLELIREIPTGRLRELVEADRDGRCVVYSKGFPIVSTYLQEGGLYIRETSGVIGYEEYNAALKGEPNGKQTGEAL